MPSSVPAAKTGLRTYLASWEGLRPADGVVVRSAPAGPDLADDTVELGDVTANQTRAGLAGKAEEVTMTCWCQSTKAGTSEEAIAAARARVYEVFGYVEIAIVADPTANGSIPPPHGSASIGSSSLIETTAELTGGGGRRAQVRFTITWTSHLG